MKVRIIVDSTADLTPEVRSKLDVVPLTIRFGQTEYVDGLTISHREFYEKLVESSTLPTTSQAAPEAFCRAFHAALQDHDAVVAITVSSLLSGTCQSATIAAEEFPGRVFVVDSKSVAIGSGILAEYALSLAEQGLDAAEIAAETQRKREDVRVVAMLDTLEYLKKGGRISAATAVVGGMLNIKPLIAVQEGVVESVGKARGQKAANTQLRALVEKTGGIDPDMPAMMVWSGNSDENMRKFMEDHGDLWAGREMPAGSVGCVIGTHVGPGAFGLTYFEK